MCGNPGLSWDAASGVGHSCGDNTGGVGSVISPNAQAYKEGISSKGAGGQGGIMAYQWWSQGGLDPGSGEALPDVSVVG